MRPENCVPAVLLNRAEATPDAVALLEKELGRWIEHTWSDYRDAVRAAALGFADLAVGPGDPVVVIAENSPKWLFCDLGIQATGAFTVGVFTTTSVPELAFILSDCGARVVVVGDQEQADKVLDILEERTDVPVERIVYFEEKGVSAYGLDVLTSYDELVERGRALDAAAPTRFDEMVSARTLDEISLVGYTSGTTGLPKGVMVSHRTMVEMTESFAEAFPMGPEDRIVAWVAVAHPAIRGPQVYTPYRNGARLAFPESADTFREALYEIAPSYIMCPPRFLEVMAAEVQVRMTKSSLLKRALFAVGMRLGESAAKRKWAKGALGPLGWLQRQVSWVLAGKPVLEKLGLDQVRWPMAGGAAISRDLLRFFHGLGFELRQVYGQAETAGVSFAQFGPGAVLPGTAGAALPRVEAKIADDGELMIRGPGVFTGYLGKPDKTADVLDPDGWYHTGDLAEFTADGSLVLLDRESAMMQLTDGRRIAPTEIENSLKFSPYISEAVLIADGRPWPTALIQIELGNVSEWAQREGHPFTTFRSLTELEPVEDLIRKEIDKANDRLGGQLRVQDFRLLPKELDVDDDELTPTRKVKRRVIDRNFGDLIGSMYAGKPSSVA